MGHYTRQSVRKASEPKRKSNELYVINKNIDGFGNSKRKKVFKTGAVEFKTQQMTSDRLNDTIQKLRGYNNKQKYRVVAVQCKQTIMWLNSIVFIDRLRSE